MPPLHASIARALLLLTLSLTLAACNKEPDRAFANDTYDKLAPRIDAIDKALGDALATFAPVPAADLPKDPEARARATEAMNARKAAFEQAALKTLKAEPTLIGWEITYSFPDKEKPPIDYGLEELGKHFPNIKSTAVRAQRRKLVKDEARKRLLSWGLYDRSERDKRPEERQRELVKGIEVRFPIKRGDAALNISLFMSAPAEKG